MHSEWEAALFGNTQEMAEMGQTAEALMEGMSNKPSSFTSATHARQGNIQGVEERGSEVGVWEAYQDQCAHV